MQEPLKIQQQTKNDSNITVTKIQILDDDSLLTELSDKSKFLFDLAIKTWCQIPSGVQVTESGPKAIIRTQIASDAGPSYKAFDF